MMVFEKAIEEAAQMFLFDSRSQQRFSEMAEEAHQKSRDWYLIRATHASFIYYNAFESQGWEIHKEIRQAQAILRDAKLFREDRVFYTMALRMEVDMLLHQSRLSYLEAPRKERAKQLFNEHDERALSICTTLLKNIPENLEIFPNAWFTSLLPLYPSFREEVMLFYRDRVKEHRIMVLQRILNQIRRELSIASAIVMTKKFLVATKGDFTGSENIRPFLLSSPREVLARLEDKRPVTFHISSDKQLPKGISQGQLELAGKAAKVQIKEANQEKDMRKYAGALLQLGIINFLSENDTSAVQSLVNTLRASQKIDPQFRELRQYRHEEFPDLPFMIGTSLLRMAIAARARDEEATTYLEQSQAAFMQAIQLNPHYHQAYVNLALSLSEAKSPQVRDVVMFYLQNFNRDMMQLDGRIFRNLALSYADDEDGIVSPEGLFWLLLSFFSPGGDLSKGRQMLLELKTLYTLNAHEYSSKFLTVYRTALRQNDEEFIADLENSDVHSAILFFIAHGFASRALVHGKRPGDEVTVDHEFLDQSVELNADSLYFNPQNGSAVRLVDTQLQIIQFALKRSEKRWEAINQNLSHRFQYYEDYLRQMKSLTLLQERLGNLKLGHLVPDLRISENAQVRMDLNLSSDQRDRLKNRVEMT